MGRLAEYLANAFCEQCPPGWTCSREAGFDPRVRAAIGYAPKADVCLSTLDGTRRISIEFEISRADPVANHAKFAVAHGFVPQGPGDVFVSMVSSHVTVGRRSLASAAILLMRHLGMSAFQTILLPRVGAARISELNALPDAELRCQELPIAEEIARAQGVVEVFSESPRYRIHFAADVGEVMLNARRWNVEIATDTGRALWTRAARPVKYFVHDPHSRCFAPSKFCAFVPVPRQGAPDADARTDGFASRHLMSMALYADLGETEPRFDGHRARRHLEDRLLMVREPLDGRHLSAFNAWRASHAFPIAVQANPEVLVLPAALR